MPRKSKSNIDDNVNTSDEGLSELVIAHHGDICLKYKDHNDVTLHLYRCSRAALRQHSEYFDVLFDSTKFSEGIAIEERLQELYKQYDGPIPSSQLPRVTIADLGDLPHADSSTERALKLFLEILHDPTTPWPSVRSIELVATLAIVADRFSAQVHVGSYLKSKGLDTTLLGNRKGNRGYKHVLEDRQRLLAGMIFGFPQWVLQCSAALIVYGMKRPTSTRHGSVIDEKIGAGDTIWWKLPGGVEGTDHLGLEVMATSLILV